MSNRHLIVYAEDDPDDLQFVKDVFQQHDHIEVLHAEDGLKVIELLLRLSASHLSPCLLILDINMPRMNGRQVLEVVRKNESLKDIPTVLFSTSSNPHDKAFAQQWNAELITKPLNLHDLHDIGKKFIDRCNFEMNKLKA